jgi:ketosteroid isomerase-like protein
MSQANVEVIRQNHEAFNARDWDRTVQHWDSAGEWRPAMAAAVESKVYRGHTEIRAYFDDLLESFAEVRAEDPQFRDLGDRVLVLYQLVTRGRDSDIAINQPAAVLHELRGGKIVRATSYLSQDQALEAAGLAR